MTARHQQLLDLSNISIHDIFHSTPPTAMPMPMMLAMMLATLIDSVTAISLVHSVFPTDLLNVTSQTPCPCSLQPARLNEGFRRTFKPHNVCAGRSPTTIIEHSLLVAIAPCLLALLHNTFLITDNHERQGNLTGRSAALQSNSKQ